MTKTHLISFLAALAASSSMLACSDDSKPSADVQLDSRGLEELEALADDAIAKGIPSVSVAIIRDGHEVTITRGVTSRESAAPLSPSHRLRMGSIAKSVVASLVLQLADEGKLSLDDSIESWLPGLLPENGAATLEQLLRQQSGIFDFGADERLMAPYMAGDMTFRWEPEQLIKLAAEHPPDFAPGERWAYSNTNFTLLAMVLEKATGDTLANLARERIFTPLGLESSTMETASSMPEPYVHGYLVGLGEPIDATYVSASAVFGNGNLVSKPLDVAHFYQALIRGQVVSENQLPKMLEIDARVPSHYAMGLYRFDDFFVCGTFVGHDGQTPGYDNVGYTSLDGRRQVAVSVGSSTMDDKAGDAAAHEAFRNLVLASGCR